jgi:hypothetical protein
MPLPPNEFFMKKIRYLLYLILCAFLFSCGMAKNAFDPERKYAPQELKKDYGIFRHTLEAWHPSLYWFTSRDSMNYYFRQGLLGAEGLPDGAGVPDRAELCDRKGGLRAYVGPQLAGL